MFASILLLGALPLGVLGADILETHGFSTCLDSSDIKIQKMNVKYNRATNKVVFDVAGSSAKEQKVMAKLTVLAYGTEVYKKEFNPCDEGTKVTQLCPVPAGEFAATGEQDIPASYASQIPSIAFSVPDLDGEAKLQLSAVDGGQDLACIQSTVTNGKSMSIPAVPYIVAGIAGAALLLSGLSALGAGAGSHAGTATPSPTFGEVIGWFQSVAMNGMLSVQYPSVYRSFAKNFAFSGGLIQWEAMQTTIDSFRERTGGNLTENSVKYLKNATLIHQDPSKNLAKRALDEAFLFAREFSTTVNGTTLGGDGSTGNSTAEDDKVMHFVHGIQGYVEELRIPRTNTFMTVLLIFAVVIAAIIVGILLFKVILETWALFGNFPKSLTSFRKRYWWVVAKTITNLILILYGIWTLYCVYQFTKGDSWAAKALAGVTLVVFTCILGYFTFKIWAKAKEYKKAMGDASGLFEDKKTWLKYSLFYENYKKSYWWIFVPTIVYMFAKGCVIAGGDGHGLVQTGGQLIIEALLLILLLWFRPYSLKSGNWINIIIQVARVLSVACILVFVQELGIAQTTQTITGIVLIVIQSVLTGLLAILIAVNALVICCRENPHRRRRKEAEKLNRDLDNLTPLDARNSLLMDPSEYKGARTSVRHSVISAANPLSPSNRGYDPVPLTERPVHTRYDTSESRTGLLGDAASMDAASRFDSHDRSLSPPASMRAPRLPDVGPAPGGYRGMAY
ncbi:hypothetical protein W97_07361 [Coniosporium apollinis CBS 100218]|uniref:ML-like domain-containing protein n=1 Tax=Coniosporium apollinis (strain CBS 100218) TaxID=1168221 RepID=R7Z1E6_CONA1|nr:uncharacterized protein W97_07361 [Coniosporium apollinis CBS 100218]EON67864.1 hypothetical protein W97_07361 [Coniosporium apollinis CBS 100218]